MAEHPNGVWIWRWRNLALDVLDRMVERHIKRIYLKVFDGKSSPMIWRHQCSPEFLRSFRDRGIEVYGWGYHYGTTDVDAQVAAVREAMSAGLAGYVVDVEEEVKNPATHAPLRSLLERIRPHVPAGALGYTSFGHPGFHTKVPWRMLNELCDLAFPQIYFESFRFKPTNEEEVQACLAEHAAMGLRK